MFVKSMPVSECRARDSTGVAICMHEDELRNGCGVSSVHKCDALGNTLVQRQIPKREAYGMSCVEGTELIFYTASSSHTKPLMARRASSRVRHHERREEALRNCVVVAVALSAHAGHHLVRINSARYSPDAF